MENSVVDIYELCTYVISILKRSLSDFKFLHAYKLNTVQFLCYA